MLHATAACNFFTSQLQKVLRTWCVLCILTCKCASHYSGVQFFHIPTSKSAPNMVCFVYFDLQMCFALQRRAIFSTSQLQKVLRTWCVLCILTCKCASRYSGVHFFISPLNSYTSAPAALASRLFDPPETQIIDKTQHFATFLTFRATVSSFY